MGGICRPSQGLQNLQPCTTYLHTCKIWRPPKTNNRIRMDYPGDNQILICTQRKLTNINRKTSHPLTQDLHTCHSLWCLLHDLCRQRFILFESRTNTERGITLLSDHFARLGLEMHIGTRKTPQKLNASSSHLHVYSTHAFYRSLTPITLPCTFRKNKARNRDTHTRMKNTPSAKKQRSSKQKDDLSPSPSTSSTWGYQFHTHSETITTLPHA